MQEQDETPATSASIEVMTAMAENGATTTTTTAAALNRVSPGSDAGTDESKKMTALRSAIRNARSGTNTSSTGAVDPFLVDPYNQPELIHTLRGRELAAFVLGYAIAVFMIVLLFEFSMPVIFNPNYPEINR